MRINPSKSFIEIIDIKNATVNAMSSMATAFEVMLISELDKKSPNSKSLSMLAPKIAGTAAKNENSVALCESSPIIRAPIIVAPERDVPGIIARA